MLMLPAIAGFALLTFVILVVCVAAYFFQRSLIYIPTLPAFYLPFPCTPDKVGFLYDEDTALSYRMGDALIAVPSFSKSLKVTIQTDDHVDIKAYWLPFNALNGQSSCANPEALSILIYFHANAGDYVCMLI